MSQDDDTEPGQLRAPRLPTGVGALPTDDEPPPTKRDASVRPSVTSSSTPPEGTYDFQEATKAVLQASHRMARYQRDLFEPGGVMARFNTNLEILVREVRGIRTDFASLGQRLERLEKRHDAELEALRAEVGDLKQRQTDHGIRLELLEKQDDGEASRT